MWYLHVGANFGQKSPQMSWIFVYYHETELKRVSTEGKHTDFPMNEKVPGIAISKEGDANSLLMNKTKT